MTHIDRVMEIIRMAETGTTEASIDRPVFNPWADSDPLDAEDEGPNERRLRLLFHFTGIISPKLLLIGEAPGYQGCHFSGVPFTNESLILAGKVPRMPIGRITTREKPWAEPSATIVWDMLHELELAERTVMWNAFPWHPHEAGDPMTNRTPKEAELKAGLHLLQSVIHAFPDAFIVAVGRKAQRAVSLLGNRDFYRVRHPSMGGANDFRDGMRGIAGELAR